MQTRTINKPMLKALTKRERGGRAKLASAIGVSPNTVSNWLRPEYDWGLDEEHAVRAAKHYRVRVDHLFPLVGARAKKRTA